MMANIEKLRSALRNADKAGNAAAATRLANMIKAQTSPQQHENVPQQHQGTLLPILKTYNEEGEIVSRDFDPTAGVVGDVISGFTAPKEVLSGELPQYLPSGELNPEFSGRAFEVGGMITPGANVTRQLPATALAKRQSAEGAAPRISEAGE
ncbi:MAG: hypothetical protein GY938_11045, partial [Ketobacter sp.]|nr:hypothetical protein [Ketobacter sp.]